MAENVSLPTPQLDWQQKFQAVLLGDSQVLPQLVAAAEAAIYLRLQALVNSPDGHEERASLTDAIRKLRVIQKETLHYPEWDGK
jgi:hypothetical protein